MDLRNGCALRIAGAFQQVVDQAAVTALTGDAGAQMLVLQQARQLDLPIGIEVAGEGLALRTAGDQTEREYIAIRLAEAQVGLSFRCLKRGQQALGAASFGDVHGPLPGHDLFTKLMLRQRIREEAGQHIDIALFGLGPLTHGHGRKFRVQPDDAVCPCQAWQAAEQGNQQDGYAFHARSLTALTGVRLVFAHAFP